MFLLLLWLYLVSCSDFVSCQSIVSATSKKIWNGHGYTIARINSTFSFGWAKSYAVSQKGYLVTVNNLEENTFIGDMLTQAGLGTMCVVLGFYQNRTGPGYSEPSGGWTWVGDKSSTFVNWSTQPYNEPNNWSQVQDWAGMCANLGPGSWKWDDANEQFQHTTHLLVIETEPLQAVVSGNQCTVPSGTEFAQCAF